MEFADLFDFLARKAVVLPMVVAVILAAALAWLLVGLWQRVRHHPYSRADALWTAAQSEIFHALRQAAGDQAVVLAKVHASAVLVPREGLSPNDRRRARRAVNGRHFEYVLCDPATGKPRLAVALLPASRTHRAVSARGRRLALACRTAGLPVMQLPALPAYSVDDLRMRLQPYLREPGVLGWSLFDPRAAMLAPPAQPHYTQRAEPVFPQSIAARAAAMPPAPAPPRNPPAEPELTGTSPVAKDSPGEAPGSRSAMTDAVRRAGEEAGFRREDRTRTGPFSSFRLRT